MKAKIFFIVCIVLAVILSANSVCAMDNGTDEISLEDSSALTDVGYDKTVDHRPELESYRTVYTPFEVEQNETFVKNIGLTRIEIKNTDDERSYLHEIDLDNGELINLLNDEKVSFDAAKVNTKYIIPEDERVVVYEMEEPAVGIVSGYNEYTDNTYGYTSSYILEGGPKKTQWHIEGNWNIVAKRKCYSHGTFWFECWDADDGDYYGWIKSYDLDF